MPLGQHQRRRIFVALVAQRDRDSASDSRSPASRAARPRSCVWRDRSRASDRSRALISGSPSACLCSSLISCLVMRSSRRQWKRAQARSSATSTIVAMQIADTIRIAIVRIISGNGGRIGVHRLHGHGLRQLATRTSTTMLIADELEHRLGELDQPLACRISGSSPCAEEIREKSGLMRSSTRRGAFCRSDAAKPEQRQDDDQRQQELHRLERQRRP